MSPAKASLLAPPPSPEPQPASWRLDAWLLAAATIACFAISAALDLHESFYKWLLVHERWQLDELPLTVAVFTSGLAWYALRRRREARVELALRKEAEARASELLRHNRELAQQLISLQESERQSLARELHDELGQTCTAIRFETAYLRRCAESDRAGMLAAAGRADAAALDLQKGVRDLLRRLRPANLDELGLLAALEDLCASWQVRSGVPCRFEHEGVPDTLGAVVDISVYRVTQEALTNAGRHAQARSVDVSLRRSGDGALELTVRDDGVGMDTAADTRGLGLLGAAERAAALGGSLQVSSQSGQGVVLCLRVPASALATSAKPQPELEPAL